MPRTRARVTAARLFATAALLLGASAHALTFDRPYGEASYKYLKLPLSPRVVGMAGSGVALADDIGELDLNPAAPAGDSTGRIAAGRGYPFSEFQSASSNIAWSIPCAGYRILLAARYLGFDNIDGYTDQDASATAYGAHTFKAQAGVAGVLRGLEWGASLNYALNNIAEANYTTAMVDLGLRYNVWRGLWAGASAVNADFYDSHSRDPEFADPFPPTTVQAGLAYTQAFGAGLSATAAVDARTRNDEQLTWPAGLEVSWRDMLFARAGWPFGEQEPGLSAGLGLRWSIFQFQYGFQSHETLGPGHYWSLDIRY